MSHSQQDLPISLDVEARDWKQAIEQAGKLLVSGGVSTDAYTDRMIESVEQHGPYIVIAPGFALAHARPDESVNRTGMAFARLASPVEFGHESNDPVTLVLALAATDAGSHQNALARLAGVLTDPDKRRILDTSQSEDEIRAILEGADVSDANPVPAQSASGGRDESPTASAPHMEAATISAAVPSSHAAGNHPAPGETGEAASEGADDWPGDTSDLPESRGFILCVCGNGVGTSLFLKNTLEQVLATWKWDPFIDVEATDTISAKGKAGSADFVLTSQAIADALGDIGVPVEIISDFTSKAEIDAALRRRYAI